MPAVREPKNTLVGPCRNLGEDGSTEAVLTRTAVEQRGIDACQNFYGCESHPRQCPDGDLGREQHVRRVPDVQEPEKLDDHVPGGPVEALAVSATD